MKRTLIKDALESPSEIAGIVVKGWVRTKRDYKDFSFIELNDGTSLKNIQIVITPKTTEGYDRLIEIQTGASLEVSGNLKASQGKGQKWEVQAEKLTICGLSDDSFPLQKKGHTLEFLREIAHLRPRSALFGAVFRVRSRLAFAIHEFFQKRKFVYVHTPIITASDCEGAGELFKVTTLDLENLPKKEGKTDYTEDFFGKPAYLTVSGQLEGELFATALSNVYTFGPTFRAENSNTPRHASEFWMIEPEMAFADLSDDMDLAEDFVKTLIQKVFETSRDELEFFEKFVEKGLIEKLKGVLDKPFVRVPYTEAVEILKKASKTFEFPPSFGINLQTEHERYLAEEHFKSPVIVYNYPREIKPFYMRLNDDGITVAAMDVLAPGIGEIIGGSQREERMPELLSSMERLHLKKEDYAWYLDTRKFGTVPHCGFGLGFERMLMYVTGVSNIRDVIPFARTPKNAEF